MILGIDEAGRGPVLGPLVLCGVWIRARDQRRLVELGVKDSKLFGSSDRSRSRRAELALQIRALARHISLLCVDAAEVDRRVRIKELNLLEQELAGAIIRGGPAAKRIVADGERLFGPLRAAHPQLEARDRADQDSPAVAAASVLAKVERDTRFAEIMALHLPDLGPIRGGGYANSGTRDFLHAYFERHRRLPPEVRSSYAWSVLQDLKRVMAGKEPFRPLKQLSLLEEPGEPEEPGDQEERG